MILWNENIINGYFVRVRRTVVCDFILNFIIYKIFNMINRRIPLSINASCYIVLASQCNQSKLQTVSWIKNKKHNHFTYYRISRPRISRIKSTNTKYDISSL